MGKIFKIFLILMSAGFINTQAQDLSGSIKELKYLPLNKSAGYLKISIEQHDRLTTISLESSRDVSHKNIYLLKGIMEEKGSAYWKIIATYENLDAAEFNQSFTDQNNRTEGIMYRVMVVNPEEVIEYTPIMILTGKS